jgi:hypothetical protein
MANIEIKSLHIRKTDECAIGWEKPIDLTGQEAVEGTEIKRYCAENPKAKFQVHVNPETGLCRADCIVEYCPFKLQ